MIKRKTIETVEEYDVNGKLLRKVTTEKDDDVKEIQYPYVPFSPYYPWDTGAWWGIFPPYPYNYPTITSTGYKVKIGDTPESVGASTTI